MNKEFSTPLIERIEAIVGRYPNATEIKIATSGYNQALDEALNLLLSANKNESDKQDILRILSTLRKI